MLTPDHFLCFTGTLTRRNQTGATDDNGDLVETETTETVRYWLYQLNASELAGLTNAEIGDAEVWFSADITPPSGLDRLQGSDGGGVWELIGDASLRTNPRTSTPAYVDARVRSVT